MSAPLIAPSASQAQDDSNFGGPNAAQMAAAAQATGTKPIPTVPVPGTDVSKAGQQGYDVFGAPVQIAKEPTVISSSNISDNVIPNLTKTADALSTKGTYVDTTGALRYSDGSAVPAPVDAEFDPNTNQWKDASGSYSTAPQFVDNPDNDPDVAQTNALFASMKANLDSTTLQQVNAIQQQYDMLRASQQDVNNRADSARTTLNLKAGTTQFAPLDAAGTALAQTSFGLQQIAKLDADENNAIAQVRAAQQSGNFELMSKALDTVQAARTAKQAAAQKVNDQLSAANAAVIKNKQQVAQDNAVGQLISQGVTNPADVLKALNDAGYNVTADQVATSLKSLQTTKTTGDTYKFANTDVGSLLGAGLTMKQIQDAQDYYNGNGSGDVFTNMTPAQRAAVQTALVGKTATKVTGGAKTYTSGTLDYTSSDLDEGNSKLQASKGSDGYVDPNLYLNLANAWTSNGGSVKDFLTHYPISSWVNPTNTFVTPAINALVKQDAAGTKTTGTSSGGSSDIATEINNLFNQTPQ